MDGVPIPLKLYIRGIDGHRDAIEAVESSRRGLYKISIILYSFSLLLNRVHEAFSNISADEPGDLLLKEFSSELFIV